MCMLNRLAIISLIIFVHFDWPIWIEIPFMILFVVCAWFADKEEIDIQDKIKNHNLRIEYNKDYIAEVSKRLDKLENKTNKGE